MTPSALADAGASEVNIDASSARDRGGPEGGLSWESGTLPLAEVKGSGTFAERVPLPSPFPVDKPAAAVPCAANAALSVLVEGAPSFSRGVGTRKLGVAEPDRECPLEPE